MLFSKLFCSGRNTKQFYLLETKQSDTHNAHIAQLQKFCELVSKFQYGKLRRNLNICIHRNK